MRANCSAIANSTGAACRKKVLPGSRYCLFHVERVPLLLGGLVGAVLSLIVAQGFRAFVPSAETRQLTAARSETSEREQRLSLKVDTLLKGNEALQKLLDPFKEMATRRFCPLLAAPAFLVPTVNSAFQSP
jgi:hypothetical protein